MDEHSHHHHSEEVTSAEEARMMLEYMYKHNASHTSEMKKLAAKLRETGKAEAAELVDSAIESYEKGNSALAAAVEKAGE